MDLIFFASLGPKKHRCATPFRNATHRQDASIAGAMLAKIGMVEVHAETLESIYRPRNI